MMNQNANEILSAEAKPLWAERTFGRALKPIGMDSAALLKGAGASI